MFEKILEKLLKEAIGQFTEQIDTNQLSIGIWSGQIQISKLKLKPYLFKKFGLPIKIFHSQLKGFKMTIPWKSLFSSPLIVQIQSAVILCGIDDTILSEQERKKLVVSFLQNTIKNVGKNIIQKMKSKDDKEEGYLDGVLLKMLDNLYLNIKNIHFRFQNQDKKFSFGLSLQALQIFAVNEKNQKIFIDRTKFKQSQKMIRRKLNISNLGFYWNCEQKVFLSSQNNLDPQKISQMLLKTMYKDQNKKELESREKFILLNKYIFSIAVQGSIFQDHSKPLTPKYTIKFVQEKLKIKLQKKIINQIFFLVDKINLINQKYSITKKNKISEELNSALKQYCNSYLLSEKKEQKKLSQANLNELIFLDFQSIQEKVQKIILLDISKDLIAKSLTLKEADLRKMMSMSIMKQKNQMKKQQKLGIQMQFSFDISQIQVFIVNELIKPIFEINAKKIKFGYEIQQKCSVLIFSLQKLQMYGNQRCQIIWSKNQQNKKFINGSIISTQSFSKLNLEFQYFSCFYDQLTIQKLTDLVKFQEIDSKLKNKAFDKLDEIQFNVTKKIQKKKTQLEIQIISKGFEVLLNEKSCTWVLMTKTLQLKQKLKEQNIKIFLKNIQVQYFCESDQISKKKQSYKVVDPFQIQCQCISSTKNLEEIHQMFQSQNKTLIKTSEISINFNKKLYISIMNLQKHIFKSKKRQIVQKASKIGQIYLKQNRWKKTLATIYNGKLYLWQYQSEFPIGLIRIRVIYQRITDNLSSLCISDKKKLYQIAFSEENQFKEWKKQLQKIVQIHNQEQGRERSRNQSERVSKKSNKVQQNDAMCLQVYINSIKINLNLTYSSLLENNQCVKMEVNNIQIKFKSFSQTNINQKIKDQTLLNMGTITVYYQNRIILQKKDTSQEVSALLKMQIRNYEQVCDVQSSINVEVAHLKLIFEPVMLIKIFGFLYLPEEQSSFQKRDQESLLKQNQNKVLKNIKFNIMGVQMVTIHKKSKLQFCEFKVRQIILQVKIKYYEFSIEGSGQQLELLDLTNYPNTLFTLNHGVQIIKRPILNSGKNCNIIEFNYKQFKVGSPKFGLQNQVLSLNIIHVQINYYHQILMRIIDYFFVQLIGSITTPQFFDQFQISESIQNNQGLFKQEKSNQTINVDFTKFIKKKTQTLKTKMMQKIGKQKTQAQLLHNQPLFLKIKFFNTIINLPILNFKESVYCEINNIQISNQKVLQSHKLKNQNRQISYCYLTYQIVFRTFSFHCFQNQKTTSLSPQSATMIINLKLFNKDFQYNFIYDEVFNSFLDLKIKIQPIQIGLNLQSLSCINRFLSHNIQHEDGLQSMMIYDYMDIVPPMFINLELEVQTFSFQFFCQNQSMIAQVGYFRLQLDKNSQNKKIKVSTQYLVVNFGQKQIYKQILTSRKNFKMVTPRKSFFRSLITTNKLTNNQKDNIFFIQSKTDFIKNTKTTQISTQQIMLILNINFIFFLKKIQLYSCIKSFESIPKVYQEKQQKNSLQIIPLQPQLKSEFQLKLQKILICYQISQKQDIILSLLFNCNYIQDEISMRLVFPHIQGFISDQEQVSCENIHQMKKRTILRPTQLKYYQSRQKSQFSLDRSFFKLSVNDIKGFSLLKKQLNKKMTQFQKLSLQIRNNSSLKQLSLNSNKSNRESIKSLRQSKTSKLSQIVDIKTIQIMIVNDSKDFLLPLIYVNTNFQFQNGFNTAKVKFYSDFFNIRNSTWQPLIQINECFISLIPTFSIKAANTKQNSYININISTNFIENLYKSFNSTQLKVSKIFDNQLIQKDQINSWIIINQMGESIICKSCEQSISKNKFKINEEAKEKINQKKQQIKIKSQQRQFIKIKEHEKQKINFLVNYHQNFNQSKEGEVLVNIVIQNKLEIKKINLNQMGLRKIKFMYKDKKCVIFKNLFTDISKNVKYVTLSSPICIQNRADKIIKLKHIIFNKYTMIDPNIKIYLPFDYDLEEVILQSIPKKQIIIKSQNQQKDLTKLIKQQQNQLLLNSQQKPLNKQSQTIKLSSFTSDSQVQIVNDLTFHITTVLQKTKRKIVFEPLYKFINYLPTQLCLIFKQKQSQKMKTQIVLQKRQSQQNGVQTNEQFFYYSIQNCEFSIYLQGYQWSQFVPFQENTYYLKSFYDEIVEIKVTKNEQKGKICQIQFSCSYILKNECEHNFSIYSNQKNKNPRKILSPKQVCLLNSRYQVFELFLKKSSLLYLKHQTEFEIQNNQKRHSCERKSFSCFCILRQSTKIHQKLLINQFTIHSMYVFKNQSPYSILIRQQKLRLNETQIFLANSSQNIHFFSDNVQKSKIKNFIFQLCILDQQYEWSCPLNFKVQKRSCFILRSRFNYSKVKYFRIKVQKTHKFCYLISLKEQQSNQVPYLLINQCQNYNIFVHNTHNQLKSNQQTLFSWDDPFNNEEIIKISFKSLTFPLSSMKNNIKKNQLNLNYELLASTNESFKIVLKNQKTDIFVEIIYQMNQKTFIFSQQDKNVQKSEEQLSNILIDLPIRIAIINNSSSPAVHVLDLSCHLVFQLKTMTSSKILSAQLNLIQIDNQAQFNAYFPVVMSTSLKMNAKMSKQSIVQFQSDVVFIKIQQQFIKQIVNLIQFFEKLLNEYSKSSFQKKNQEIESQDTTAFFISKVKFPKIKIDLQVQTKKFSIETVINLQKPAITTYPWKQFPYPIKKIAINVLSHLSISPWSFISSFKKGVEILLTQQQTGRAFQGFFGSIIGALSNSINGLVGMIVGHDIQRVNTFAQGISKGFGVFFSSLSQIPDFQGCHNLATFVESSGKTLINLVFKPVKGVLRMTLKITQGIKKTAKFSFDQKTQIKTRLPIVFYNREQYFLKYDIQQSKLLQLFKKLTYNKLSYFYLVQFFKISHTKQKYDHLVVLGTEQLILLSTKTQKMLWNLEINKIQSIKIVDICKIVIIYSQNVKQKFERKLSHQNEIGIYNSGNQIYQVMMENQKQAVSLIDSYIKIKQSSLIQFEN